MRHSRNKASFFRRELFLTFHRLSTARVSQKKQAKISRYDQKSNFHRTNFFTSQAQMILINLVTNFHTKNTLLKYNFDFELYLKMYEKIQQKSVPTKPARYVRPETYGTLRSLLVSQKSVVLSSSQTQ